MSDSGYVSEAPAELSGRALEFLRTKSQRVPVETGLTGDALRAEITRVYGTCDDRIVDLLSRLQSRYSGLSYESGFFQSQVTFAPVCEPDDPRDELEILYAVETASPAGASVKVTGEVEIGLDGTGAIEFASLDALIECDAMFASAEALGVETRNYLTDHSADEVLRRLTADEVLGLRTVPGVGGSRTAWFEGSTCMVFFTSFWSDLKLGFSPILRVWARSDSELQRFGRVISAG
jgi:hypothetical protein